MHQTEMESTFPPVTKLQNHMKKKISNKTFTDPNMRCWTESKGETYRNRVSTLENTPLNIYDLMNTLLAYSFTLIHPKQDVS